MVKSKRKPLFKTSEFVIYPTHGVGQVTGIETLEIGDEILDLYIIYFEQDKMTLRVPLNKAIEAGMRNLSDQATLDAAFETLRGRARVKRAMWSRRAQEYEQKINSGNLIEIAEVVRDLCRIDDQREQSYSERQLYQAALERLTREIGFAAYKGDEATAKEEVEKTLLSRKT